MLDPQEMTHSTGPMVVQQGLELFKTLSQVLSIADSAIRVVDEALTTKAGPAVQFLQGVTEQTPQRPMQSSVPPSTGRLHRRQSAGRNKVRQPSLVVFARSMAEVMDSAVVARLLPSCLICLA